MARRDWIHGSTIDPKTKALRYASVSSLDKADTANDGCPRQWAYNYLEGIKPPETDKQKRGTEGHAVIEDYEKTGDTRKISPDVAPGLHIVPDPGPDLHIEWDVLRWPDKAYPPILTEKHSPGLLAGAAVKLSGVPFLGFIDCWHRRGTNKGGSEVSQTRDPAGTVEVIDWKFTGDSKFWKKEHELVKMTQLAAYATWVFSVIPDAPAVRLSLGYFPARGRVTKVTKLARREDVQPQLDHARGVVRLLQDVCKEPSAESVEANTDACSKYGGCFYRSRCSAPGRKTLTSLLGSAVAERTLAGEGAGNFVSVDRVRAAMSILKKPIEDAVGAEMIKIADSERRSRLLALVPEGFPAACVRVRKHNVGFPTGKGAVARALRAIEGEDSGADKPGSGDISYIELTQIVEMAQLADELDQRVADGEENVPTLPPDAPASDPAKASDDPEAQEELAQAETEIEQVAPPAPTPEVKTPAPVPVKAVKTKAKKSDEAKPGAIHLFIDCDTSVQTESLDGWAVGLARDLAQKAGCSDIRLSDHDSLSFGKWKATLAAFAMEAPLPGSNLSMHASYGEIPAVVAEALMARAIASGGSYTRGSR